MQEARNLTGKKLSYQQALFLPEALGKRSIPRLFQFLETPAFVGFGPHPSDLLSFSHLLLSL